MLFRILHKYVTYINKLSFLRLIHFDIFKEFFIFSKIRMILIHFLKFRISNNKNL